MPRFTLHRPSSLTKSADAASEPGAEPRSEQVLEGLRHDSRLRLIGEMPRMLLIDGPEDVAEEWLAKMPGWVLKLERKASIPDPRPKLRKK